MTPTPTTTTLRQSRLVLIVRLLLHRHNALLTTKGDSLSVARNDPSMDWKLQPGSLRDKLSKSSTLFVGAANVEPTSSRILHNLTSRIQHHDVGRLVAYADPRMMQGLPSILDRCKEERFDPDAFIIWAGESVAQYMAQAKAQMTRSYLPQPVKLPSMYPSTISSRT